MLLLMMNTTTQHPSHPLHKHTSTLQGQKNTTFYNSHNTTYIPTDSRTVTTTDIKNKHASYTYIYCL